MPAPTPTTDSASLWLLPTPLHVHLLSMRRAWDGRLSHEGPMESAARRILMPLEERRGIRLRPGDPEAATLRTAITTHADLRSPGSYRLEISSDSPPVVSIHAADETGLRHGLVTLAQVLLKCGLVLPAMTIEDSPAIQSRGVMLDISRDRVPSMKTLRDFLDTMERLKLNHLQLYTEHTFAYRDHQAVWSSSSPMTAEEVRELDSYAAERGIELAANQNCLGHLHRWLKQPEYSHLSEIPPEQDHWTFETDDGRAFTKVGPHSLCPTHPGSIELIEDLLGQLLPCFKSRLVNIGCDEAFDVGQGRSRGKGDPIDLYFQHLHSVDQIVKKHGKRSLFWADIAWRHLDRLDQVPSNATALIWGYEGDSFERLAGAAEAFARRGVACWYCPGTSSWLSITGRTRNRHVNLKSAARYAAASGSGFLVCDWGDRGHRQQWPISLHGIAHAAHEAWTGSGSVFEPRAAALHLFGDASGAIGPWLDDLGDADTDRSSMLRNTNAIFTELHRPLREIPRDPTAHGTLAEWHAIHERLSALYSTLEGLSVELNPPLVRRELTHSIEMALHAAEKALLCRACLSEPDGVPGAPARIHLAADLAALTEEHRELWLQRSRPGGLDDSAAHYERIINDYEHPHTA